MPVTHRSSCKDSTCRHRHCHHPPQVNLWGSEGENFVNARIKMSLAAASVAALALAGCGSDSLSGAPEGSSSPSASVSENTDLAAKLPEKIKTSKKIVIGTDASYA